MFSVRESSAQFLIVGEETRAEGFLRWVRESERSLAPVVVAPETAVAEETVDCLVVDSGAEGVDSTAVVERWQRERPAVPVVVLTDAWRDERVADALATGATATLPRRLVDDDPKLLADRLLAAVDAEHGSASFDCVIGC